VIFVNGTNPPIQIDDTSGGLPVAIDRAQIAKGVAPAINGAGGGLIANDLVIVKGGPVPFEVVDAGIWQKSVAAYLILSIVFLLLSIQFVSPTRRWRLRRGTRRSEAPA
jgi:hypothetical protein